MILQHVTQPPDAQKNFLVVDAKTETSTIEQAFNSFTQKRKDIAILLINQHVHTYTKILAPEKATDDDPDRGEDTGPGRHLH